METLYTHRLTLRPLSPDDLEDIVRYTGDFEVSKWLTRVAHPYTRALGEEFIAGVFKERRTVWSIHDTDGFCGIVGLEGEFGYWLGRHAWGKGYGTEMGDAVLDQHFADPEADLLISSHFVDNVRSAHVLRKLGFVDTGPRTHHSIARGTDVAGRSMALHREDWHARRSYRVETERLVIRHLTPDDAADVQRIGGDRRVAPMLGSVSLPWTDQQVKDWITQRRYRGRTGFSAIVMLRDGTVIGTVSMTRNAASLGWFIDPDHWGQGYATEAMRGFLADCFERFDLRELVSDHFTENGASARVHAKLGFERTGTGMAQSRARLEPAPITLYRLTREQFEAAS